MAAGRHGRHGVFVELEQDGPTPNQLVLSPGPPPGSCVPACCGSAAWVAAVNSVINIAGHSVKQRARGNMRGVLGANFETSANQSEIAVDGGVRSGNKIPRRNFDRVKGGRGAKYWNAAEPGKPHDRGNPEMAERNLWLGVLETAIVDLQS